MRSDPAVVDYRIDHTHGLVVESLSGDPHIDDDVAIGSHRVHSAPAFVRLRLAVRDLVRTDGARHVDVNVRGGRPADVMVSTSSEQRCQVPAVDATKSRACAAVSKATTASSTSVPVRSLVNIVPRTSPLRLPWYTDAIAFPLTARQSAGE